MPAREVDPYRAARLSTDGRLSDHGAQSDRFDGSADLARSIGKEGRAPFSGAPYDQAVEVECGLDLQVDLALGVRPARERSSASRTGGIARVRKGPPPAMPPQQVRSPRAQCAQPCANCYWANLKTGLIRRQPATRQRRTLVPRPTSFYPSSQDGPRRSQTDPQAAGHRAQGFHLRRARRAAGADRCGSRRLREPSQLFRPVEAFGPRPDDPSARGQRRRAGQYRAELRPMAVRTSRFRRRCAPR